MSKITHTIKTCIKKITPKKLIKAYHFTLAFLANIIYGFPSHKLIVIGVTGTNGKTSTCNILAKILEESGKKVGMMTTINFKIGDKEWVNTTKQGMQGRFRLQKFLKKMLKAGCEYVIVESTSQGIEQFRSFGIAYDLCIFTNITPEHIEAHGGFEKYKAAKLKLFKQLESRKEKVINGKKIERTIVANFDDKHALEFINFKVDKIYGFGVKKEINLFANDPKYSFIFADNIELKEDGSSFDIDGYNVRFNSKLIGMFNVYNVLAATSACIALGIDINTIKNAVEKIENIKGRMQFINIKGITGVVDYAHDPNSLAAVYKNLLKIKKPENKLIAVIGSCGGGRDKVVRFDKGNTAGAYCDYVIVTNEDPYDDNPEDIINDVFEGVINEVEDKNSDRVVEKIIRKPEDKKIENVNVFKVLERRDAILKAVNLANVGDIIVCTGKGAEKGIATKGGEILKWDEIEELTNALNNK